MQPRRPGQVPSDELHDEILDEPRRSHALFFRWLLLIAIGVGAFFAIKHFVGPGSAHAGWGGDWNLALDQAASTGKPMLVLFTADWCPPCRYLKSDVLADSEIADYLSGEFVLLKVDLTNRGGPNDRIADEYDVDGVPTFIVFNSKGDQITRQSGAGPKEMMLTWFRQARSRAR